MRAVADPGATLRAAGRRLLRPGSRAGRVLAAGVALIALAVYATWPLVPHLDEFLDEDDPFISAWGLWWTSSAIAHLDNPYYTREILAPQGAYLSFHAFFPLLGVLAAPLTWAVGPALTYNVLKLVLPIAAVVGAYALARTLRFERPAAWVAGAVYGFSIVVVWRTTLHMNFGAALGVVPLAALFAVRFEQSGRWRDAVLSGAAIGACVLIDPTMALFAGLAVLLWVVLALGDAGRRRRWLPGIAVVGATALVVGAPQLAMMLRALQQDAYDPDMAVLAQTWVDLNTNLHTLLSPGNVRSWLPGALEARAYRYPWGEATPAYGWGALGLGLVGALAALGGPRLGATWRRPLVWAAAVFLLGTVLALGPELTVTDDPVVPLAMEQHGQRLSALMPYTWMVQLPLLSDVRVPSRFVMLGMLGLAILAGGGFAALRHGRTALGAALAGALVLMALAEAGFPDGGSAKAWVPATKGDFYAPVRDDPDRESVVVDVPLAFQSATGGVGRSPGKMEPMLRATEHGHPIATGKVTRLGQPQLERLASRPLYAAVLAQQGAGAEDRGPAPPFDAEAVRRDAAALDVGWVVVWPSAAPRVEAFLEATGFRFVHARRGLRLYRRTA